MVENYRHGIPPNYFGAQCALIKNLDEKQRKILIDWAKNPQNFMLFAGLTGRGKTYASIALMYLFEKVRGIEWDDQIFQEISLLNQIWLANFSRNESSENFALLQKMQKCKVLVLDDLGIKTPSDSFFDYIYCLLNHRSNDNSLITIINTNCNSEELNKSFGPRIVSRISQGKVVKFEGPDL